MTYYTPKGIFRRNYQIEIFPLVRPLNCRTFKEKGQVENGIGFNFVPLKKSKLSRASYDQ
jgi:hypothetical protein